MFDKLPKNEKLIKTSRIYEVPISRIIFDRAICKEYDTISVVKLASSIKKVGLIEPIILRLPCSDLPRDPEEEFTSNNTKDAVIQNIFAENNQTNVSDKKNIFGSHFPTFEKSFDKLDGFSLISGGFRLRAYKLLGFETIPARFALFSAKKEKSLPIVEEYFSSCSSIFDKAKRFVCACKDLGSEPEEIASVWGFSGDICRRFLTISLLDDDEVDYVTMNKIPMEVIYEIAMIKSKIARMNLFNEYCNSDITLNEVKESVNEILSGKAKSYTQTKRFYCKQSRLFINSITKTVNSLKDNGFDTSMTLTDDENECRIVITISKESFDVSRETFNGSDLLENCQKKSVPADKTEDDKIPNKIKAEKNTDSTDPT